MFKEIRAELTIPCHQSSCAPRARRR